MAQLVKTMAGLAIASVKTVNGLAIASAKTVAGLDNTASGPNTYYDITTTHDGTRSSSTSKIYWQNVTVGAGGSATKIRWYCQGYFGGSEVVKAALYNGTTLMSSGSVTVNATGYFEITLAVPQSVSAATYVLATAFAGSSAELGVASGVGTHNENDTAGNYTAFPPATLPAATGTPASSLTMGVFVA